MARRSDHSREELAAMVVQGARAIARTEGWQAVSMRGIATRIGYAPGSIYNAVGDIDLVLLRVNAETLGELGADLETVLAKTGPGLEGALALADAYIGYVTKHARLWAALMERPPPVPAPDWYAIARARLVEIVGAAIAPLFPDAHARRLAVLALWAALQGVASLTLGGNLAFAGEGLNARRLARSIVRRYLTAPEAE